MKTGMARALLLATAAVVSCGNGSSGGAGDGGLHGPTDIVVKWTLDGKPASTSACGAHMAKEVFVNLSATIDPTLHHSISVACEKGTTTFSQLLIEDLGQPYLEGTLLDDKGVSVAIVGVNVSPALPTTTVELAFFAPMGMGGGGMGGMGASSTTTSTTTSMGGMGGMPATSTTSSTASTTSSSASSTATGTGGGDAGP